MKTQLCRALVCLFAGTFTASVASAATAAPPAVAAPVPNIAVPAETPQQKAARMKWWTDARFGMFIHWGLYSVPAGEWKGRRDLAEWFMDATGMPRAQYEQFAKRFNPTKYDPDEWVRIAKDAGMKYIVITAKHHEGFAMWDTRGTDYNIARRTPYGRGVLVPLAAAARRAGLHFGTYYSIMDWHDPSQSAAEPGKHYNPTRMDPKRKSAYVAEMKIELAELIRETHTEVLWFDGEWVDWWTDADGRDLYAYLHRLDPKLIINNRIGHTRDAHGVNQGVGVGDFGTPEQEIPPQGYPPGVYWESCMTLNDHWGYNKYDDHWKSPTIVVHNLVDIASKGGNYLLNIGPTAEGVLPAGGVAVLRQVGRWMHANGVSIYGTSASPFAQAFPWGRVTRAPGRLYLHVFDWPAGHELALPFTGTVHRAYLLTEPNHALKVRRTPGGISVKLPAAAPDDMDSVIVLEVPGASAQMNGATAAATH